MRKRMIGFVGDTGGEERRGEELLFLSDDQAEAGPSGPSGPSGTKRSLPSDDEQPPATKRRKDDVIEVSEDDEQDHEENQASTTLVKFVAPTAQKNPPPKGKGQGKGKGKGNSNQRIGPSGVAYSPLEEQILEIKQRHPGVVLIFEVGYKLKF